MNFIYLYLCLFLMCSVLMGTEGSVSVLKRTVVFSAVFFAGEGVDVFVDFKTAFSMLVIYFFLGVIMGVLGIFGNSGSGGGFSIFCNSVCCGFVFKCYELSMS